MLLICFETVPSDTLKHKIIRPSFIKNVRILPSVNLSITTIFVDAKIVHTVV